MECIGYGSKLTNGIIMEEITASLYVSFYSLLMYFTTELVVDMLFNGVGWKVV